MSTLGEERQSFTKDLARLYLFMISMGYRPMKGKDGMKHMKNSLHYEGLAEDIDLCDKDGNYLPKTEHHRQFGVYWKSLNPNNMWGGDWNGNGKVDPDDKDGNHYSRMWGGRK